MNLLISILIPHLTGSNCNKDMACRTLLLKLERRGVIHLPARQGASPNGLRNRKPVERLQQRLTRLTNNTRFLPVFSLTLTP